MFKEKEFGYEIVDWNNEQPNSLELYFIEQIWWEFKPGRQPVI